jgi:hypothetical protein
MLIRLMGKFGVTHTFLFPTALKAMMKAYPGTAKGHRKKLVQAREVLDLVLASVVRHTASKCAQWQIEHELRKYELALVHGGLGRKPAKSPQSDFRRSNRDQTQTPNSAGKSLTYDVLM